MKKFALIGEKLGHSYSPEIHKETIAKLGVEGIYSLLEVTSSEIPSVLEDIRAGNLTGINVTIPYKVEVMKYLDVITEEAKEIGAVNTVSLENGKLTGHNTDYWGFRYTLENSNINVKNKTCVVLGGGGSARSVIKTLEDLGGITYLVSRSPDSIKKEFSNFKNSNIISYKDLETISGELIVNTTPLGMSPNIDTCAVSSKIIKQFNRAIDLIYNPEETLFLSHSENGENGLYMLVGQAVKAEEIWWKKRLDSFDDIYATTKNIVYKK